MLIFSTSLSFFEESESDSLIAAATNFTFGFLPLTFHSAFLIPFKYSDWLIAFNLKSIFFFYGFFVHQNHLIF